MTLGVAEIAAGVGAAAGRVAGLLAPTPLQHSPVLSGLVGTPVHLKCEHVQPTGSFKVRGAANALTLLHAEGHARVITASTGNHGMAAAHVGALLGVRVEVHVPQGTEPVKRRGLEALGAAIVTVLGDSSDAERHARATAQRTGLPYLSPYNDPAVVCGQGTVALEILEQLPDVAAVYASVGGGGLLSGMGAALAGPAPGAAVVGCWPSAAPTLLRCIEAGRFVEVVEHPTVSDGTAGGIERGAITVDLAARVIDRAVEVSEPAILEAMRILLDSDRWIVEGAAAVALAGAMADSARPDGPIVVVLCGRNLGPEVARQAFGPTG